MVNRVILDLGCNIGASCFLAARAGARSVLGIDKSPKIISTAIRLNTYFALPCKFIVHDLNMPIRDIESADTVFCFSIWQAIKNKSDLVKTICMYTKQTLYFEGHADTNQDDYRYLLNKDNFSSIKLLGYMQDAVDIKKFSRPFFRCER